MSTRLAGQFMPLPECEGDTRQTPVVGQIAPGAGVAGWVTPMAFIGTAVILREWSLPGTGRTYGSSTRVSYWAHTETRRIVRVGAQQGLRAGSAQVSRADDRWLFAPYACSGFTTSLYAPSIVLSPVPDWLQLLACEFAEFAARLAWHTDDRRAHE